jgi:hypothetical protein
MRAHPLRVPGCSVSGESSPRRCGATTLLRPATSGIPRSDAVSAGDAHLALPGAGRTRTSTMSSNGAIRVVGTATRCAPTRPYVSARCPVILLRRCRSDEKRVGKRRGDAYLRPAVKYTTGPTGWIKQASNQAAFGPRTSLAGRLARSSMAATVVTASSAPATRMVRLWRALSSDHFLFATFRGYTQARACWPARAARVRRRPPASRTVVGTRQLDIAQHRLVAVQHDLEGTGVG